MPVYPAVVSWSGWDQPLLSHRSVALWNPCLVCAGAFVDVCICTSPSATASYVGAWVDNYTHLFYLPFLPHHQSTSCLAYTLPAILSSKNISLCIKLKHYHKLTVKVNRLQVLCLTRTAQRKIVCKECSLIVSAWVLMWLCTYVMCVRVCVCVCVFVCLCDVLCGCVCMMCYVCTHAYACAREHTSHEPRWLESTLTSEERGQGERATDRLCSW